MEPDASINKDNSLATRNPPFIVLYQKNNMNEDLPESDQNTTLEKMVTEELNRDDEDKKDDTVLV